MVEAQPLDDIELSAYCSPKKNALGFTNPGKGADLATCELYGFHPCGGALPDRRSPPPLHFVTPDAEAVHQCWCWRVAFRK